MAVKLSSTVQKLEFFSFHSFQFRLLLNLLCNFWSCNLLLWTHTLASNHICLLCRLQMSIVLFNHLYTSSHLFRHNMREQVSRWLVWLGFSYCCQWVISLSHLCLQVGHSTHPVTSFTRNFWLHFLHAITTFGTSLLVTWKTVLLWISLKIVFT